MARPRSDIRKRILVAARERFLYEGVDGASLRRIARDAGTNIGMVYYYFPEKDALLLAVVGDVYDRMLADLERALDPAQPLGTSLRLASQRIGEMSEEETMVVRLVIREMLISSTRRDKLLQRFSQGHLGMLLRVVMAAHARGEIRQDVSPLLALVTLGAGTLLPQFVARTVAGGVMPHVSVPDPATLATALLDNVMHGLLPQQSPTRGGSE